MCTHGTCRSLPLPANSRSPPHLIFIPPLSKVASAMSHGGGRVGDGVGGDGDGDKKPGPGAHPRYVPKRGSVLKGIVVRGMLGLTSTLLVGAPASSGGNRVRPAPPGEEGGEGDHGAEQGK